MDLPVIDPADESVFDICDEILASLTSEILSYVEDASPRLSAALKRLQALDGA